MTVAIVGDGAVGLLAVLSAKQMGASMLAGPMRFQPFPSSRKSLKSGRNNQRVGGGNDERVRYEVGFG
jgi:hypothetical protein